MFPNDTNHKIYSTIDNQNHDEDYVKHKFSSFIDQEFSYGNKVNTKNNININKHLESAIFLDGNMSLEPRLFEYIKKKKFYKDNKIEEIIPLEKQFQITDTDMKIIRDFLMGKKNMYTSKKYTRPVDNLGEKFVLLSEQLKGDKRVPKVDYMKNPYKANVPIPKFDGVQFSDAPLIMGARDLMIQTKK